MQHMGTPTRPRHVLIRAGFVPSPPASHTPRARPQQNRNGSASRRLARGLAPFPSLQEKAPPWPWRRCAGPPAAWRQGGAPWPRGPCSWRTRAESPTSSSLEVGCLIAYLNCPSPVSSPPHHRVPLTASSVELLCSLSRISLLEREAYVCCVARSSPGPACLVFDGMSVQARRLDAVF
jgi:hypothetical protein